jgi:hypothetical protein
MNAPPTMRPYGRQILVCNHGDCAVPSAAERLHTRLGELNREFGLNKLGNPHRIKCARVDCLGVCQGGQSWSSTQRASGITMSMRLR